MDARVYVRTRWTPTSARTHSRSHYAVIHVLRTVPTRCSQLERVIRRPWSASVHAQSASAEAASVSTHDAELQRLLLAGPPAEFDFRAEVTACTRQWVDEHAPELSDLVDDGTLVVVPRRPDYQERRSDGYQEPGVVLLVGTAHVSRRSQQDVSRVIRAVVPDSVVVELCKSRSAALAGPAVGVPGAGSAAGATAASGSTGSSGSESEPEPGELGEAGTSAGIGAAAVYVNPMNLGQGGAGAGGSGGGPGGGGGFFGAVARSVALGGQSALLLRVLLAGLASRTAGSLGVTGGGEFAAAQAAADAVGAQVVLGDRPVEITLSRAWAALPLTRRMALCGELLRGATGSQQQALNEELVERLKGDDAVGAFFKQMSSSYPELVAPLVTERDLYLAWSLKRSKAVNGAGRVVGVVGRGHLRGAVYALLRDEGGAGLRFTDLVDGRNSRDKRRKEAAQGAAQFGVELALGTAAYFLWLALTHQSV